MNNNPLVSVIIPSYGGPEYLPRCVNSVLNQTYNNIEIIVVDDNGIGTTKQIETEATMALYKSNSSIKYICHEHNINGSAARNTGFRASAGEYISFLDDDDEYNMDFVERQVRVLDKSTKEYALSYTSFNLCSNEKIISTNNAYKQGDVLFDFLNHNFEMPTSSMLFKRSVIEEIGGFDESFRRHQDWEFVTRIVSKYKIIANDFIGYKRHLVFRNSTNNPKQFKEYRLYWLNKMRPYIMELDTHRQNEVYFKNRMDVLFMFLKTKNIKGALEEWKEISPGIDGIKYIIRRLLKL